MGLVIVQSWIKNNPLPLIFIKQHLLNLMQAANLHKETVVGVYLVSPSIMAMNNFPRGHSTDSLAIPYHNPTDELERRSEGETDDFCLGEILLCPERISKGRKHPLMVRKRVETLLTHSFVHLLGYDHPIQDLEEGRQMHWIEFLLKQKIKQQNKT